MATIFESIRAGDVDAVRSAVRDDPSAAAARDDKGLSAVRAALYAHRQDVADVLLETGPDLDVFDAAAAGDVERLTELLDGDGGFTPLMGAEKDDPEGDMARLLKDHGAEEAASAPTE